MENKLVISSSPHIKSKTTTHNIMLDVLIALIPTAVAATVIFGYRALVMCIVCVAASVTFETLYRKGMGLSFTALDLSAAVTGLILALNLPSTMPLWMAIIGCFVATVIVKQLFGGLGKNFANPAIVGRIVLLLSFTTQMTSYVLPKNSITPDAVTGATLLSTTWEKGMVLPTYLEMFMGQIGGSLGETCKFTLLLGGVYLVVRRVITPTIPLAFMGTVAIMSFALGADPIFHLLTGGVVIGAIFMATDYVTSPTTEKGKLIFGIGCGVITVAIRLFGSYPEGVSFAILLMNIVTPHIDKLTASKAFGGAGK